MRYKPTQPEGLEAAAQSGSQSRVSSRERQSSTEFEPSSVGRKRKRSPSLHNEAGNKPYFCFHESCDQTYKSGKLLGNHIQNKHRKSLNLPGTCNLDNDFIRRFEKWEDCLEHFIYHQKNGIIRKDYERAYATAEFRISCGDERVDTQRTIPSPAISLIGDSPTSYGYGAQQSNPQAMATDGMFTGLDDFNFDIDIFQEKRN
jgi:hypothetical protein